MGVLKPRKVLSLDANLVFDLAEGRDFAHEFREAFTRLGYGLFIPPTALHELNTIRQGGGNLRERELATKSLASLRAWSIQPFDLDSSGEAIAHRFVQRLLRQRLIPEDEFNDGMILAETSLAQIPLLVTSDRHLLDIDEDALLLEFNQADLFHVRPAHPGRLPRALR
jgi:hypothetical protein